MTIPAEEFREDYEGNGNVSAYDYSWRIYDESELAVYQLDNDGNETKLILNQDYTVSGVRLVSGGQITLSSNLPNGYRLTIIPDVPVEQQTDFRNQGRFFPETHEEQFDKLAVISKQQSEVLSRAIKMSAVVSPADFNPEVPAGIVGEANVLLMTDATGTRFIKGPTRPEIEGFVQEATEQANRAKDEADRAEDEANKAENAADNIGYTYLDPLTFNTGATLSGPNDALFWDSANGGNDEYYRWAGELPKVVPELSTPESTGEVKPGAWRALGSAVLSDKMTKKGNTVEEVGGAALKTTSPYSTRTLSKAVISFIFDDTYMSSINVVEPLFDSRNITCGFAGFTSKLNDSDRATVSKLRSLQDKGYEILSHGDSLTDVDSSASLSLKINELKQSYEGFRALGINVKGYVPLSSDFDLANKSLITDFFNYGFPRNKTSDTGIDALQDEDLQLDNLFRTSLVLVGKEEAKNIIDLAISNNAYVQFYDHDPSGINFTPSISEADLTEVIDYAISQGVTIANPSDAIDMIHSDTLKTVGVNKLDRKAETGINERKENLIIDSQFTNWINWADDNVNRNWIVSPVLGSDFEVIRLQGSDELRFDPDGMTAGQQVIIQNKRREFKGVGKPSSVCFSLGLRGVEQLNTNYTVTVGIQARKISDDSVVYSDESTKATVDAESVKRYYATCDVGSDDVYINCFVRVVCDSASTNAVLILKEPQLNIGSDPAPFSHSKYTMPAVTYSGNFSASVPHNDLTVLGFNSSSFMGFLTVGTNGQMVVEKTGIFSFFYLTDFVMPVGSRLLTYFNVNGTEIFRTSQYVSDTAVQATASITRRFEAGDIITIGALQDSNTTVTISPNDYNVINVSPVNILE